jgi:hypothetical protein
VTYFDIQSIAEKGICLCKREEGYLFPISDGRFLEKQIDKVFARLYNLI